MNAPRRDEGCPCHICTEIPKVRLRVEGREFGLFIHGDDGWELHPMRINEGVDVQEVIAQVDTTVQRLARGTPGMDVVVMVAHMEPPRRDAIVTRYEWFGMDAASAEAVRLRHGDGGGR